MPPGKNKIQPTCKWVNILARDKPEHQEHGKSMHHMQQISTSATETTTDAARLWIQQNTQPQQEKDHQHQQYRKYTSYKAARNQEGSPSSYWKGNLHIALDYCCQPLFPSPSCFLLFMSMSELNKNYSLAQNLQSIKCAFCLVYENYFR